MKRARKILLVCAAVIIGVYVAYQLLFPTVYLRLRLTLDVDVDGVTRTGSGVVEISYWILPDSLAGVAGGTLFHGEMRGYAITVDLGQPGLLFVVDSVPLLQRPRRDAMDSPGSYLGSLPLVTYGFLGDDLPSFMERAIRQVQAKSGPIEVPLGKLPMMVRFADINDKRSIEEVDPHDLASAFGPGVQLKRATVEITRDPISPLPPIWPVWLNKDTSTTTWPASRFMISTYAFKGK
jgi:hypothetical protein